MTHARAQATAPVLHLHAGASDSLSARSRPAQVYASPRAQEALRAARAAGRVGEAGDCREKDREAEKLLAQILNKPVGVPKAQFYSAPPP